MKKLEKINELAREIANETEGVSVFVGAKSFEEDYVEMMQEDNMTAEEISDRTAGFVKEDGSFPKGTVYLEEDGDSYDQIFVLDDGVPGTDLWYKNSKAREKIKEIIDLIND